VFHRLAVIGLLLITLPAFADESADARAARYYAAGLEQPLLLLRAGTQLVAACKGRLRAACSKQQRELAAQDRTVKLLDALTLFPQRPATDPVAGIARSAELKEKIASTGAELLRASGDYDAALFARYGAILRTCPDPDVDADAYRASLDALIHLELASFRALASGEVDAAKQSIAEAETSAIAKLGVMPPEDCVAAHRIGGHLMELMQGKLRPWGDEERPVANQDHEFVFGAPPQPAEVATPDRELANAVAGNFVSLVATELELLAFPEREARIKAITDEIGPAKPAQ
jgi:hypothetical protein